MSLLGPYRQAGGWNGNLKPPQFLGRVERLAIEEKNLKRMPRDVRVHWVKHEQAKARASASTMRPSEARLRSLSKVSAHSYKEHSNRENTIPRSTLANAGRSLMEISQPHTARELTNPTDLMFDPSVMSPPDTTRSERLPSKERGARSYSKERASSHSKEAGASSQSTEQRASTKKAAEKAREQAKAARLARQNTLPDWSQLAMDLNVPPDDMRNAKALFDRFDQVPRDGVLSKIEFRQMLAELVNSSDSLDEIFEAAWKLADIDGNGNISFTEFAKWYSTHGFVEDVNLTPEQCAVRAIARKYDLPLVEVESIKAEFNRFDEDGSGEIEYEEFVRLLYKLLKVPSNLSLPASRVDKFWLEIDQDGSGAVNFEEFLVWYLKYFGESDGTSPLEEFYNVRRFSAPA